VRVGLLLSFAALIAPAPLTMTRGAENVAPLNYLTTFTPV